MQCPECGDRVDRSKLSALAYQLWVLVHLQRKACRLEGWVVSRESHKSMRWDGIQRKDCDTFQAPDGTYVNVLTRGLTLEQAQRAAYDKWRAGK